MYLRRTREAAEYRRGFDRGFWTAAVGIAAFFAGRAAARWLSSRKGNGSE